MGQITEEASFSQPWKTNQLYLQSHSQVICYKQLWKGKKEKGKDKDRGQNTHYGRKVCVLTPVKKLIHSDERCGNKNTKSKKSFL